MWLIMWNWAKKNPWQAAIVGLFFFFLFTNPNGAADLASGGIDLVQTAAQSAVAFFEGLAENQGVDAG